MDEAEAEVEVNVSFDALGRKELQALAKSLGIRANQTSEQIRVAILQRKEKIVSRLEEVSSDDNDEPITGTYVRKNIPLNVIPSKSDDEEGGGINKRAPPITLVPILFIGEEQEHKLILKDQNRYPCDGDDDNDNDNKNKNNNHDYDYDHDHDHDHDDKYEKCIEGIDVNITAAPNKGPFKASNDRIVKQQTLNKILISTKRDDITEYNNYENYNSEINSNKGDHHDKINDNKNVCSSSDGKASDETQDKENSDYATDENENKGNNISIKGGNTNKNLALNKMPLGALDKHIVEKLTSTKISYNSKRGDTVEKSEKCMKSNRISNHEKFSTKLPKYVTKKSIERQKNEIPLWRVYSKDFCGTKGIVKKDKRPQQVQTKLPGKGMRRSLHNRSENTCKFPEPVITTRHYKAGTKKVVSMAMSKRNEEHMQKFLHRQSTGRQDRIKRLEDKIYAGLA